MDTFCETYHLHNLVKSPASFKNPEKASCTDLILTNCPKLFMNTKRVESSVKWGLLTLSEVGLFQIFNHIKTIKNH